MGIRSIRAVGTQINIPFIAETNPKIRGEMEDALGEGIEKCHPE